MIPTQVTLNAEQRLEVFRYYSKLLRLEDWDIEIILSRGFEIPGTMGRVRWTLNKKRATICMVDPNDHPPDADPLDMEYVLVHELLHVSLAYVDDFARGEEFERNSLLIEAAVENHIDSTAWSLVKLRREGAHRFSYEIETK